MREASFLFSWIAFSKFFWPETSIFMRDGSGDDLDSPLVSKLPDGRLFWYNNGDWAVLENGFWDKPPEGIKLETVTVSKPLPDEEIRALISKGMLPNFFPTIAYIH